MLTKEVKHINFTLEKVMELQAAYDRARTKGETQFVFEGHDLLTDYAKYLIEFLYMKFADSHQQHECTH
jgi:hypothetical protein